MQTVRDADGEWRFISFSGEPVFDREGGFAGYRGIARDVTQTRRAEERIRRLAHFDELTGLPNRTMFMHTLQRAFSLAQRRSKQFALFFIDLDRFKNINDSLGHEAGDRLLQDVARRLRHHLRESDTVARLGGDEFVVLVEDCADSARAQRDRAEHPERGGTAVYAVRPRVPRDRQHRHRDLSRRRARPRVAAQERGHRDVPREGPRQEQFPVLLAAAERALVRAPRAGERAAARPRAATSSCCTTSRRSKSAPTGSSASRRSCAGIIPTSARSRRPSSSRSPKRPASSCRSARWVLRTACAQSAAWRSDGLPGVRIAVNLSARQFSRRWPASATSRMHWPRRRCRRKASSSRSPRAW